MGACCFIVPRIVFDVVNYFWNEQSGSIFLEVLEYNYDYNLDLGLEFIIIIII